ncbi:DUF4347 domain-containing protein, partial [Rhodocista pekingensis]
MSLDAFSSAIPGDAVSARPSVAGAFPVPVVAGWETSRNADRREVAFIDQGIADWRTLAAGVRPGIEVVLLDTVGDGLARMAAWARTRQGYDAIHVFSHGAAGTLILGSLVLDGATAASRAADLAALGAALGDDGDLLVYGCEVAKGETGAAFVDRLADLTGATVAASVDLTGNEGFGGTWALAYPGRPDGLGPFPLVPAQVSAFQGTLADASFTFDGGTGETNPGEGADPGDMLWTQDGYTLKMDFADVASYGTVEISALAHGSPSALLLTKGQAPDQSTATITFSLVDGYFFTLSSIDLSNEESVPSATEGDDLGYVISASGRSDITGAVNYSDTGGASKYQTISTPGMNFITSFQLTLTDADRIEALLDSIILSNIVRANAPVMTGIAGTVAITEDVASSLHTIFTSASFADSDSPSVIFTISADTGTLSASSGGGVSVSGTGTGTLTLAGAPGDIATFLKVDGTVTYLQATPDANGSNKATLTLSSADADGSVALGSVQVNITAVNDAPVITSDGGGATAAVTVAENTTTVTTVVATDVDTGDTITYSIDGGADQNLFNINSSTGALTFKSAPDFEAPGDNGANNTYEVIVKASDGNGGADSQTVNVTVTNVNEAPTLTATGANPTFTEGGSAKTLFTGTSSSAIDAGQTLTGLTLTVSNVSAGDILSVAGVNMALDSDGTYTVATGTGTVAVAGSTATVTVTGLVYSTNSFNSLVNKGIQFSSTSTNPGTTARVVTITGLTDSGASDNSTSLNLTSTVSVVGQPDVTSVTLPPNGTYKIGDNLTFTVNFDQAVTVDTSGGTPRIALTVGSTTTYAEYVSGSGSAALAFSYTVGTGDADADGLTLADTSLQTNGGTLTGTTGGIAAALPLGTIGSLADVKVDGVRPTITGVSIPDQTYKIGDTITVTITAGEAGLSLHGGSLNGIALTDLQDKGGGTYTAIYTVSEGDSDRAAGGDIPVHIVLKDAAGNISDAWTTPISQSNDAIDATAPAAPTLGFTDTGASDSDGITKDNVITVSNLEAGAAWKYSTNGGASWTTGTGIGFALKNGTYSSTDIIVRQIDAAGNSGAPADLSAKGATIVIDRYDENDFDNTWAALPELTISRGTPSDDLTNADELIITLNFSEKVANVTVDDFEMVGIGGAVVAADFDLINGANALEYTVKVSGGDIADYNGFVRLSLKTGHGITDLAGNPLLNGLVNSGGEYTLDNTVPTTPTLALASDTG